MLRKALCCPSTSYLIPCDTGVTSRTFMSGGCGGEAGLHCAVCPARGRVNTGASFVVHKRCAVFPGTVPEITQSQVLSSVCHV